MAEYVDRELIVRELLSLSVTDGLYGRGLSRGIELALSIVNRQDTADVVEVKQGEWLKNNTECSVCKKLNPTMYLNEYELEYYARPLPHCPFCCAKMDGGKNEDSN